MADIVPRPSVTPASTKGRYSEEYKQSIKNHPALIATLSQEWKVSEDQVRKLLQNKDLLGSVSDETVDKIVGQTRKL